MAKRRQSVSVEEEDAFRQVIDEIIEEIVWHPTMADTGLEGWLLKMVDYNVPLGKQIRYLLPRQVNVCHLISFQFQRTWSHFRLQIFSRCHRKGRLEANLHLGLVCGAGE